MAGCPVHNSNGVNMSKSLDRYSENAAGPFYVEKGLCIACRNPEAVAADIIGFTDDISGGHCFFKRQPQTARELERAMEAVSVNCCGSYRYAGDDSKIKDRLKALGRRDAIDE